MAEFNGAQIQLKYYRNLFITWKMIKKWNTSNQIWRICLFIDDLCTQLDNKVIFIIE